MHALAPFAAFGRKAGKLRGNFGALVLATSAFVCAPFQGLAEAAMPGRIGESREIAPFESDARSAPSPQVLREISGSPYPGVIDCLLQTSARDGAGPDIHINYPSFGNKLVDDDIRGWVSDMAEAFASQLETGNPSDGDAATVDEIIESVLNGESGLASGPASGVFELWGAYKVSRPSKAAVSIAFELWNYTGNPEGNLDIITLNYSLLTGQRLNFVDIFEKPDVALELMSVWSRKQLEPRLGAARRSRMLMEGTEPLVENFSSITLTPEGICINFQPWQVAPQDAGIQRIAMPLEELLPSSPLLALWGKGENEKSD